MGRKKKSIVEKSPFKLRQRKLADGRVSLFLDRVYCYHFAVAMSFMAFLNVPTYTSGGGGSSNNELPKKRDDLEEIARARRCAEAARAKIGVVRKRGFRR